MKLTKVIILTNEKLSDLIVKKYSLKIIKNDFIPKNITVFDGLRESQKSEEKIVLVLTETGKDFVNLAMSYVLENYDAFKIINLGLAKVLVSTDIKPGDIILPNTFLSESDKNPIFLDYATGENYDLVKFGLILSGISLTLDTSNKFIENKEDLDDDYITDIIENEAYFILDTAQKNNKLEKCVVIKSIIKEESEETSDILKNSIEILDFIL